MKSFLFFILSFLSINAFATHLRSGYIAVERTNVGSLTCKVTVTVFTDTESSVLFGGSQDVLDFGDGTEMLVPETASNPYPGLTDVGVASFTILHTFSGPGKYTISYIEPNRNAGVINMANSVGTTFYIETTVDLSLTAGFNSTPEFLMDPIFNGKLGSDLSISAGASSNEDYILLYTLGVPFRDRYTPVTDYQFPENISINPYNGIITWDTKFNNQFLTGEFAFTVKVSLFKEIDGAFFRICTMSRDIQIILEESPLEVLATTNTELDANGRIYVPENAAKTVKIFFEKNNNAPTVEVSAVSELSSNATVFSFTTYDSTTLPNIKVGVLTLTSHPDINRENPYVITVRGKYGDFAKDVSFLFFTQDLQPKLTEYVEIILNTDEEEIQSDAYPNPSTGMFTISLNENEHAQIHIHDQTGKLIKSLQSIGPSILDLRDKKAGFYYLTVYTGGKAKRIKLLKN